MKLLVADDDPIARRMLEVFLSEWGYDVAACRDGRDAWEVLQNEDAPGLVISDWKMPHMDGLELCTKLRSSNRSNYTYFILLTSKTEKEDVIRGLEAGADDFVSKPFNKEELRCRVQIGKRIIELEQKVMRMAMTDPLTGLLNRRRFMERMASETNRAVRADTTLSIIMTDIDFFKRINDTHGHQAGDRVLQHFSEQLTGSLRTYDFVGRFGGEEFIICLPGTDRPEARMIADRIHKHVSNETLSLPVGGQRVHVTASFGVATFHPAMYEDIESVIKRADDALYQAKSSGRNRVCSSEKPEFSAIEAVIKSRPAYSPILNRFEKHWAVNNIKGNTLDLHFGHHGNIDYASR